MKPKTPHYYALLPKHLHIKADAFIHYLTTFPYGKPACCMRCGSSSLWERNDVSSQGIRSYQCRTCEKVFNQLTGTPFARTLHLQKWPDFAYWRLSGLSILEISRKIAISPNGCKIREKKLHD